MKLAIYARVSTEEHAKEGYSIEALRQGDIVVEIIPLDESKVPAPKKGQHITVTGAYVLDKHHGWMEIHPAWIIDGKGSANYDKAAADKSAAFPSDE